MASSKAIKPLPNEDIISPINKIILKFNSCLSIGICRLTQLQVCQAKFSLL